ncbi:hypothetical protein ACFFUB_13055 [Algimonas porphyrae]|uniref:EF-hand domain-containing protein n=1 Tax=Algimonas porphyrae TaxID=1128113 RepID=A0ABQ5UX89_9PROT|nr:hypothetical protein [Algimonas porphyrae]GLQ19345.1 hypothetical protein GCM10007854_03000 [Algimonas porphyrae]
MSNALLKYALLPFACMAALAASATAQDTDPVQNKPKSDMMNMSSAELETLFATHDADLSGDLNLDEFIAFTVDRASHGDETARDLVVTGDYEGRFAALDQDADSALTLMEVVKTEHDDAVEQELSPTDEDEKL